MTAPTSMPTALVATGSARGVSLTTIPASASRSATPKASAIPATGMFSEIRSAARMRDACQRDQGADHRPQSEAFQPVERGEDQGE